MKASQWSAVLAGGWLVAAAGAAEAGPWVPDAGEIYAKLDERVFLASRYTTGDGETLDIAGYQELTTALYGEVGLGDRWAALVAWDLARVMALSDGDGVHVRPGDARLGLRWSPLDLGPGGRWAVEAWAGLPFASSESLGAVVDETGRRIAELRAGPGVFEAAADLSVGWSFEAFFFEAAIGYLQRFGGQDGALRWQAAAGGRAWAWLEGAVRLAGFHRVDTGDAPLLENPSGLTNGSTHTSAILELGARLSEAWTVGATGQFSIAGLDVRRHGRGAVSSVFVAFSTL